MCTLLFDLEPTDITGPLTHFQSTKCNSEDFKRLLRTINSVAGDSSVASNTLEASFDKWWPDLESKVLEVLKTKEKIPKKDRRTDRDIIEEILEITRMVSTKARIGTNNLTPIIRSLIESVEALSVVLPPARDQLSSRVINELHYVLKMLCIEAGMYQDYEQLTRRNMYSSPVINESSSKSEAQVSGGQIEHNTMLKPPSVRSGKGFKL